MSETVCMWFFYVSVWDLANRKPAEEIHADEIITFASTITVHHVMMIMMMICRVSSHLSVRIVMIMRVVVSPWFTVNSRLVLAQPHFRSPTRLVSCRGVVSSYERYHRIDLFPQVENVATRGRALVQKHRYPWFLDIHDVYIMTVLEFSKWRNMQTWNYPRWITFTQQ